MSSLPSLDFKIDATNSCNWKCCLTCNHPQGDDPVYINAAYQVKKLNPSSPKAKQLIEDTNKRIAAYINEKMRSSMDLPKEATEGALKRLREHVTNSNSTVSLEDLKKISQIFSK